MSASSSRRMDREMHMGGWDQEQALRGVAEGAAGVYSGEEEAE